MFRFAIKGFRIISFFGVIAFSLVGINWYIKELKFLQHSLEADGVIVDFVSCPVHSSGGMRMPTILSNRPVVEYVIKDRHIKFKSKTCFNSDRHYYQWNQKVTVVYDPKDPENAHIKDIRNLYSGSISALIAVGMLLVVFVFTSIFRKFINKI